MRKLTSGFIVLSITLLLVACGGDTNIAGDEESTTSVLLGSIQGINYSSTTYNGVTDSMGGFNHAPGEVVSFSIGNLQLGSVNYDESYISIVNVVGSDDITGLKALNTQKLIMALDNDANLDNGITLVAGAASLPNLDLTDLNAIGNALAAIDTNLQLPSDDVAIEAYDSALYAAVSADSTVLGSYETISSYLLLETDTGSCIMYNDATVEFVVDSNSVKHWTGSIINTSGGTETFDISGSKKGYTSLGTSVSVIEVRGEYGSMYINAYPDQANPNDYVASCIQQIRMNKVGGVNILPKTFLADRETPVPSSCNGGAYTVGPFHFNTHDTDGTLSSVSFTKKYDGASVGTTEILSLLNQSYITSEYDDYITACGTPWSFSYVGGPYWDTSKTPVPILFACLPTEQVPCGSTFSYDLTTTDNEGGSTTKTSKNFSESPTVNNNSLELNIDGVDYTSDMDDPFVSVNTDGTLDISYDISGLFSLRLNRIPNSGQTDIAATFASAGPYATDPSFEVFASSDILPHLNNPDIYSHSHLPVFGYVSAVSNGTTVTYTINADVRSGLNISYSSNCTDNISCAETGTFEWDEISEHTSTVIATITVLIP